MRYCSKPKVRICLFLGLPCGPVVKTPLCNAGDAGSIPGQGPKIPHPVDPPSRSLHPPSLSPQREGPSTAMKDPQATVNT